MEKEDRNRNKRDWIDYIETITKIAIPVIITVLGLIVNSTIKNQEQENRRAQLYAEIMSQRERADSNLRTETFKVLINNYLGKPVKNMEEEDPEKSLKEISKKLIFLELLAWNFHDTFNIKPLFKDMDEALDIKELKEKELNSKRENLKERLQKIAQEIVNKQAALLDVVKGGKSGTIELMEGEEKILVENNENLELIEEEIKKTKRNKISVELKEVKEDSVELRIRMMWIEEGKERKEEIYEFGVSYYDMPFIDNTRLPNGKRFAVILKNVSEIPTKAKMKATFLSKGEEDSKEIELVGEDTITFIEEEGKLYLSKNDKVDEENKEDNEINISIKEIKENSVTANVKVNGRDWIEKEINKESPLTVSISEESKFELALQDTIKQAVIEFLLFPGEYASLRDKPYYQEILNQLKE